jgi:glycosyltransferase involved in cell wall biosynthesis
VLSPRDPYPVIGGDRLRVHRIACELARRYDLTLLTFCGSKREREAPLPADSAFKRVQRIVLPKWRSYLNALAALPSAEPLQVAYYRSAEFRAAADELAPSHDAVLVHLVRAASYARNLAPVSVLDMTDAISMSMERTAATPHWLDPRRFIYSLERRRLPSYERQAAQGFDLVTLTSPVDKDYLFKGMGRLDEQVMVVANGVDVGVPAERLPRQEARNADEIAFVGNLESLQNFDAVWFFARHVLPLVRERRPAAELRVLGTVRSLAARRLSALPGVRVEGFAPRLDAALATARVGVCPTRAGAGIQNKVLNYFAGGLAVVCSPVGLEGLDARPDEHVLLAVEPREWADQVVRLLEDRALAQRLADAGRALAVRQYRWESRVEPLLERLEQLLDGRAGAGREAGLASSNFASDAAA